MELVERVGNLEKDVAQVKTDVAVIRSNYVTKEDLHREIGLLHKEFHKEIGSQTWRFVTFVTGAFGAIVTVTYFIAKHVA